MNQEDSEQNEADGMKKGADSTGMGDAYVKERLVICNDEDTGGRARVQSKTVEVGIMKFSPYSSLSL